MAYQANKPLSTDQLNVSQGDIAGNFTALNTSNSVNHVAYNDADQGKHKFITLPQQTVVPATYPPATSATEFGFYNKTNGANPALFIRFPSAAAGDVSDDIDITTSTQTANGTCTLPCGIILKWGEAVAQDGAAHKILYPVAFPTNTLSVQLTHRSTAGSRRFFDVNINAGHTPDRFGFETHAQDSGGTATAVNVYYFAIGY